MAQGSPDKDTCGEPAQCQASQQQNTNSLGSRREKNKRVWEQGGRGPEGWLATARRHQDAEKQGTGAVVRGQK